MLTNSSKKAEPGTNPRQNLIFSESIETLEKEKRVNNVDKWRGVRLDASGENRTLSCFKYSSNPLARNIHQLLINEYIEKNIAGQ